MSRPGAALAEPRGHNLFDGGAAFYDTYECADGEYVALGCVEPQFYGELLHRLELDPADLPAQYDLDSAAALRERIGAVLATRTRQEWAELFADTDACLTPVLSPWEAPDHPQHAARGSFVEVGGVTQPTPAPRFDRTPASTPDVGSAPGDDTDEVLRGLGYDAERIAALRVDGALA